jgi:hypothetical protein
MIKLKDVLKIGFCKTIFIINLILVFFNTSFSQELEPRNLTNLPVGVNALAGGYVYSSGNILLDPAIPIENLKSNLHTFVFAYLRTINLFGLSSKIDVVVPLAFGDWDYALEEENVHRKIDGFGDPRIRISINLFGAPAIDKASLKDYRMKTIVGFMLQVITPFGQYEPSELINLGSNRWNFRTNIGVAHALGEWILEVYLGAFIFTDNSKFLNDSNLKQKPLLTAKTHIICSFSNWGWIALNIGYGLGGRTEINSVELDTRISTFRFGLTFSYSIDKQSSLKLTIVSGKRIEKGPDFDAIGLAYQFLWF